MVFFNITILVPWRYPLEYPFARVLRYWSCVGTSFAIFGRQQPELHFNYQSHCRDGSGNNCINCFDVLFSYFLLTSPIFFSILFHLPDISTTILSISSISWLQTFFIISIVVIRWSKWSDLSLIENWLISDVCYWYCYCHHPDFFRPQKFFHQFYPFCHCKLFVLSPLRL